MRGPVGLVLVVLVGFLLSYTLQAIAPIGVTLPNSPTVADAQRVADAKRDLVAPRMGARAANLTVVIFTDYRCPACRSSDASIQAAVKQDGQAAIVFRHHPIFGPASVVAARTAIAAQWQGKFMDVHNAFMAAPGDLDDVELRKAAISAGADWALLQTDLQRHRAEIDALLARNAAAMFALGLRGTPSYLVGNYLVEGALTRRQLLGLIKKARAAA
jgi:protein-disulfide isomerase